MKIIVLFNALMGTVLSEVQVKKNIIDVERIIILKNRHYNAQFNYVQQYQTLILTIILVPIIMLARRMKN